MPYKDKEKRNEYMRKYRLSHRNELLESNRKYRRKYRESNPEKNKESIKKYRLAHKGKHTEENKQWRLANLEKARESSRKWKKMNPGNGKECKRLWCQANPDKVRLFGQKRRARKKQALGVFSLDDWRAIKKKFKNTCPACGRKEPEVKLTMDHIIALAKGGKHDKSNIQPLCISCNSRKQTYTRKWNAKGQMEFVIKEKSK